MIGISHTQPEGRGRGIRRVSMWAGYCQLGTWCLNVEGGCRLTEHEAPEVSWRGNMRQTATLHATASAKAALAGDGGQVAGVAEDWQSDDGFGQRATRGGASDASRSRARPSAAQMRLRLCALHRPALSNCHDAYRVSGRGLHRECAPMHDPAVPPAPLRVAASYIIQHAPTETAHRPRLR